MTDREKVIKGLECCSAMSGDECGKCPYGHECRDTDLPYGMPHLAADTLALLKAQEPMKPRVGHDGWYRCGSCSNPLASGDRVNSDGFLAHPWPRYCEMCGRAVKWDG